MNEVLLIIGLSIGVAWTMFIWFNTSAFVDYTSAFGLGRFLGFAKWREMAKKRFDDAIASVERENLVALTPAVRRPPGFPFSPSESEDCNPSCQRAKEAAALMGRPMLPQSPRLASEQLRRVHEKVQEMTYISYLGITKGNHFFFKLITCPYCLVNWLALIAALAGQYFWGGEWYYVFIIAPLSLISYKTILRWI